MLWSISGGIQSRTAPSRAPPPLIDSISDILVRPGSLGPAPNHGGPPRAAKASSIRRYMRPSTSPSTSLNPNFA